MLNKKGFLAVPIVYSFLVVFILFLFIVISNYLSIDNDLNIIINDAKEGIYNE